MTTYIHIQDTRYTVSQIKAMRKVELVDHVMGLSAEINRLNREIKAVTTAKKTTAKKTTAKKTTAKTTAKTWKNVNPSDIHASFKLAGVTQTMQRRATFALQRGDSPTDVANFAVGTRQNKRWEKIKSGAIKARA